MWPVERIRCSVIQSATFSHLCYYILKVVPHPLPIRAIHALETESLLPIHDRFGCHVIRFGQRYPINDAFQQLELDV
jgi:hypothetical protein